MASSAEQNSQNWAEPPRFESNPDVDPFENDSDEESPPPYERSVPEAQAYPPAAPSLGYSPDHMATGDVSWEIKKLRKALDELVADKKDLLGILSKCDPLRINLLRHSYQEEYNRDLETDIAEVSGHIGEALLALARGPLRQDVFNARKVTEGDDNFIDVLVRRSNADLSAIKSAYFDIFKRDMIYDMKDKFGGMGYDRAELYNMILAANRAEESAPVDPKLVEKDAQRLWHATNRPMGKHVRMIFRILTARSDVHIRAIVKQYKRGDRKQSLKKDLKWKFSSKQYGVDYKLPKKTLLLLLRGAVHPVKTDAKLLEKCMKGVGTRDTLLINRIVRIHWDKDHLEQVKEAYRLRFKKDLKDRVASETSGHYQDLLLKLLK